MRTFRHLRLLLACWLVASASVFAAASPSGAAPAAGAPHAGLQASRAHQLIQGSGSSWAANAVIQWIADVRKAGLQVVFGPTGSAQGRIDFASKTSDFAVSDIGFLGKDPVSGADDTSNGRAFAYLPIVAGGTSLPYNLIQNGQRVRNLRLSPETIAKIFTQKITNWSDDAITKDNNGHKMPNIPIIPVQHSEGSGSSYQFSRYLSMVAPDVWKTGANEYFPQASGSAVAQNGSDLLMNYLTSNSANGAIGYDEYSYALNKNFPVAKVLNKDGYYTLPTQYNVAVALTQAKIDKTTLLQTLDNVYTYNDPRTYPISSYSYAIIPTASNDSKMSTAKRQTMADYLQYSVCAGQAEMGRVGYSPLPYYLVNGAFARIQQLHSADSKVDVSSARPESCNNPTFDRNDLKKNYLALVAPKPAACDKIGAGPCTDAGNTGQANPDKNGRVATTVAGGSGAGTSGTGASGTGGTGGTGGAGGGSGGALQGGGGATGTGTHVDPNTGQVVSDSGSGVTSANGQAVGTATVLDDAQGGGTNLTLALLAGGLLLGALVVPALVAGRLSKRGEGGPPP